MLRRCTNVQTMRGAIEKYEAALKESNKLGVKTEHIDEDFTTLANLKIVQCYYRLAENTQDANYYQDALVRIEKVWSKAYVPMHQEELTYLWAEILYKIGKLDQAESKFNQLIKNFPKSQWIPKGLYTIGEINYQQNNKDKTLSTFRELIAEFPHSEFKMDAEQYIAKLLYRDDPTPPQPDPECEAMYKNSFQLKTVW